MLALSLLPNTELYNTAQKMVDCLRTTHPRTWFIWRYQLSLILNEDDNTDSSIFFVNRRKTIQFMREFVSKISIISRNGDMNLNTFNAIISMLCVVSNG